MNPPSDFTTRRGRLLFFFDVHNLYSRKNQRSLYHYVARVTNAGVLLGAGADTLLPRLPSFGIQWDFQET